MYYRWMPTSCPYCLHSAWLVVIKPGMKSELLWSHVREIRWEVTNSLAHRNAVWEGDAGKTHCTVLGVKKSK